MTNQGKMWFVLFALAVSTVLNAVYYIRAIGMIYSKKDVDVTRHKNPLSYNIGMGVFIVANVMLGLFYQNIVDIIQTGLKFL